MYGECKANDEGAAELSSMKIRVTVQIREASGEWADTEYMAAIEADASYIDILLQYTERLLQPLALRNNAVLLDGGIFAGARCKREEIE